MQFNPLASLPDGREIGYLVSDDGRLFLSIKAGEADPYVGLFVPAKRIHVHRIDDETYLSTLWNKELDDRLRELTDSLIRVRLGHPKLRQLRIKNWR